MHPAVVVLFFLVTQKNCRKIANDILEKKDAWVKWSVLSFFRRRTSDLVSVRKKGASELTRLTVDDAIMADRTGHIRVS